MSKLTRLLVMLAILEHARCCLAQFQFVVPVLNDMIRDLSHSATSDNNNITSSTSGYAKPNMTIVKRFKKTIRKYVKIKKNMHYIG